MVRIDRKHLTRSVLGASLAFLRVCIVALGLSGVALSAGAAGKKSIPPRQPTFREFIDALWPNAQERGVSRATFDNAFAGLAFDPKVVANAQSQPEFVRPIWEYIASAVTPDRIERGRDRARSEDLWLARAKEAFGVDEAVLLGVWGLETDFGGFAGSNSVIQALAKFRLRPFTGRLLSRRTALGACHTRGGRHRSVPHARLLGRRDGADAVHAFELSDLRHRLPAPRQTRHLGERSGRYRLDRELFGETWLGKGSVLGVRSSVAGKIRADRRRFIVAGTVLVVRRSRRTRGGGSPLPEAGEGRLLMPAGLNGPVFLVTSNFDVIKAYNNSTAYALSVGLLGDAVTGGRPLVAQWPIHDRALTTAQIMGLQVKLKNMGYEVGDIDGKIGDTLRSAVSAFQERNGLIPDGYASQALFSRISALR